MKKKLNHFKFLIAFLSLLFISSGFNSYQLKNNKMLCDCSDLESITIEDVLKLEPEGTEDWTEKAGFIDGTYYEATIIFSDNTRGLLFRGASSGRYFIEDSNGNNYYYNSLRSSVRALYMYKKYGCFSSKYRL